MNIINRKFNYSQLAKMKKKKQNRFLTCPCHRMYREEANGLKSPVILLTIAIFVIVKSATN